MDKNILLNSTKKIINLEQTKQIDDIKSSSKAKINNLLNPNKETINFENIASFVEIVDPQD